MNLDYVSKNIPNSYFIYCKRNNLDTAQSILKRMNNHNDKNKWWSMKPPSYEEIMKLNLYDQIAYQVTDIEIYY